MDGSGSTQPLDGFDEGPETSEKEDAKPYLISGEDGKKIVVENDMIVGREQCGGDPRVSLSHFRISRIADFYIVEDLSTNGTDINGERLPKKKRVSVREGDVVGVHDVPSIQFTFHHEAMGSGDSAKRRSAERRMCSVVSLADKIEETLFCSVCRDVMYKPVSLLPCLHNFCSYCLGQCLKSCAKQGKLECPMARCDITGLKRNALVESMVDTFLEHNPAKKRTVEDMKYADDNDELRNADYKLDAFRDGYQSDDDEDDIDADSSSEYEGYCGCCGMGVNDLENQCEKCSAYLCNVFCGPMKPAEFLENASIFDLHLPQRWLQNEIECKILDEIFTKRSVHISDAAPSAMSEENKNAKCCRKCTLENIGDALYTYRQNVPPDELPEDVRNKRTCWWGKNCRTQLSKDEHAKRLDHACEQTRVSR